MRRWGLVAGVLALTAAGCAGAWRAAAFTFFVRFELDRAAVLATVEPRPQATLVFDRAGRFAFSFFVEQRTDVPLDRVSPHLVHAVLAIEDKRFTTHRGVDPIRIVKAAYRNLRAGRIREGASTITQQLARAVQLSPERSYERKIREVLVAVRLEQKYSKSRILEEYLNTVYLGEGYYGVEAAARGYFGKPAADVLPAEAALIAALARSPSTDAPSVSPDRARKRRNLVLRLMREQNRISDAELRAALDTKIPGASRGVSSDGGISSGLYFREEIRRQLFEQFGARRVLRGGLRVHTTYDPHMQREAERAIADRIAQIVKARPRARDLQGSLVALDPRTGDVLALVGGRDFLASSFNRATQARRQAGSAFKPIIFAAALERGYAPGTLLRDLDAPIDTVDETWLPDGEHEAREYTLRRALKVSSNRAAARLLQQVGVNSALHYARRLGIASALPMVPSLALGTGEVTLLELTAAYSAFANRGVASAPRFITRVEDASGTPLWHGESRQTRALAASTAYLMSSMLADVVSAGTGATARAAGFRLPAAGKTGTTDRYADAWFIGYTPHLLAGVWFGLDRPAPIMREGYGGVVAVPAWARFMRAATRDAKAEWYAAPPGVERVAICRISGERAAAGCRYARPAPSDAPVSVSSGAGSGAVSFSSTTSSIEGADRSIESATEYGVYEDLAAVGALPSTLCHLHGPVAGASGARQRTGAPTHESPATADISRPSAAAARRLTAATRLVVDRVPRGDGTYRTIIRQIPQQR